MANFTDINSLNAIHVYGWEVREFQNPSRTPGKIAFVGEMLVPPDAGGGWVGSPPDFVGDRMQALNLLDEMETRDWCWKLTSPDHEKSTYTCDLYKDDGTQAGSTGETLAQAVCHACLTAVGVDIIEAADAT